jgi:hypothetical protein
LAVYLQGVLIDCETQLATNDCVQGMTYTQDWITLSEQMLAINLAFFKTPMLAINLAFFKTPMLAINLAFFKTPMYLIYCSCAALLADACVT